MKKLFTFAALMFALSTAEAATRLSVVKEEDKDANQKLRGFLDFEKEEVLNEPELEAFLKADKSTFTKVTSGVLYAVPQLGAPKEVVEEKKPEAVTGDKKS